MKWIAVAAALIFSTFPTFAQDPPKKSATDEMMAMYVEMAKPVAEHKRLMELAGNWNVTTKLWFDPAGEPMTASGTAVNRPILGGRFLQSEADLKGAMAAQSLSLYGFDRRTGDYSLVAFDTLGTYYITAAGKWDEAQKAIVLTGSYLQPPANAEQRYRFVWTFPSADRNVATLYFATPDGKEMRIAETTMTRSK